MDLYNQQIARGDHTYRGFGVRGHLKDLRATAFERIRALHEDRAIGSILDSYTPDVMMAFVRELWSGNRYVDQRLRTLLDFLGGHHLLLRGQLQRSAEFADMFVMEFPNEGSQPCHCWIFMIDNGKTNNTGKRQYLGAMRHKEVLFCSQGALAQYLFHRFHLAGHPWPDFKSPPLGSDQLSRRTIIEAGTGSGRHLRRSGMRALKPRIRAGRAGRSGQR